jgi:dipeptidyl-peptidase-4
MKHLLSTLLVLAPALGWLSAEGGEGREGSPGLLRDFIERYSTDLRALERQHRLPFSPQRWSRLSHFQKERLEALSAVDFNSLDQEGRIDYLLLRSRLRFELSDLEDQEHRFQEVSGLIPFFAPILELLDSQRNLADPEPERWARVLTEAGQGIDRSRKSIEEGLAKGAAAGPLSRSAAGRLARILEQLKTALQAWEGFYAGYDPEVTWWIREPCGKAARKLEDLQQLLRRKVLGAGPDQDEPIVGDPIGRPALLAALESEMIPYTPEELLEIAEREFAWCESEYRRAAGEMGFGDDWRKALERVKGFHLKPGQQPRLIKDLAEEAVLFVEKRELVTVPELCKETWRMEMMSPERQKVSPFFTGGEVISVSYPTDSMSFEDKLMSMRGNNVHFSRATVHHELIPGHHLQGFMAARHRAYRSLFRTPFLVEGWALYWEMLLWDLGFPRSPEDRVGMLFWRAHRSARVVFSLKFHLAQMSAQEAIDYLIQRVGHEPENARAEVRRSVAGDYGPLYQASYLLGGLQLRALHRELVGSGKMKDREFHDAVLRENAIPIEMIRASLLKEPLTRESSARWRFYDLEPAAVVRVSSLDGAAGLVRAGGRQRSAPGKLFRDRVDPHWLAGSARFWYLVALPGDRREFVLVDAARGTREPAFDHQRLARALSGAWGRAVEPDRLPFGSLELSPDGRWARLSGEGPACRFDLTSYELEDAKEERPAGDQEPARDRGEERREAAAARSRSPDGRFEALVRSHNLYLRDLRSEKELPLSRDGHAGDSYQPDSEGMRAVELGPEGAEPKQPQVYWSPDSRWLVALRTRPGADRKVYLVESSPRDQLQPKLHSYPYLKPGDDIPVQMPHLFEVEPLREIPLEQTLFPNPWSVSEFRWSPDSARFTFLYNQRGHQALRILSVEARSGRVTTVVGEESKTFIDYANKRFTEYLDETGEVIWMSERDGWNHLYLFDVLSGRLKNQITRGEWVVRGVERVDREKRRIWFRAGGIRAGQDPYQVHLCRVDLDGSGLVVLTEGDGTHSTRFSPDRLYFLDTWSRVDLPPVTELRKSEDGALVLSLERGDARELLERGWRPPERFVAKGRDGSTDIYGVVHRPARLDPSRKYPVIESIYAGPHGSFVPKSFRPSYREEELAERGFIVVQIDGMGTSNRSKRFQDVAWKNLGDAGFPDRILWMKALAEKYPYLDLTRVGIYGGSAGGQNAVRALLAHGDFYKAAAADCGCHDNRMDKIWWNELFMGWPVGPHYEEQSNVTQAHRLRGKLLLIVGELDRNVDPSSTWQLVNGLIKADKDFELLVVPGAGHGAGGGRYGWRRQQDFFVRHLLGLEPEPAPAVETISRSF